MAIKRMRLAPWFKVALILAGCAAAVAAFLPTRSHRAKVNQGTPASPFVDVTASSGLSFSFRREPRNIRETVAPGVAFSDFDGDGWVDVFLVGQRGASPTGGGKLFRNRGDGTFEDRTEGSGVGIPGYWMGCAVADIENDGLPDLLLSGYGDRRLFKNLGGTRFRDVTRGSGLEALSDSDWSTACGFSDLNRDGLVDLVLGRYVVYTRETVAKRRGASWTPEHFEALKPSLFLNLGGGRFRDATQEYGLSSSTGKTLGVAFADANGDGYPDVYLANDTTPCDLYFSQGGRRLINRGLASETAYNFNGGTQAGMGADWADFSGDGRPDLVVTTFEREPISLYVNEANGFFRHASFRTGVGEATIPFVGWGIRFLDYDLDGFLDLVCVNGHVRPDVQASGNQAGFPQLPQLFRGGQEGQEGSLAPVRGNPLGEELVARGLAVGDFNNDGSPDVLIGCLMGSPRLLAGSGPSGNWVGFRLQGTRSNRMAIGARVTIRAGGRTQVREIQTAGSYLSAQDPRLVLGLGTAARVDSVDILWPSGLRERHEDVATRQYHTYVEPSRSSKTPEAG